LPPEYTFLPWVRRGMAAEIATDDRLGGSPEAGPAGRATLPVELTLEPTLVGGGSGAPPAVRRDVAILGPGDVAGVKAEAISRTQPAHGTLGAAPGELAFVEFYDEDFPWRYTPARAVASRLRPWIALLVLQEDEFDLREPRGALPVVTPRPGVALPLVTETWAWAHGQVTGSVGGPGQLDPALRARPDLGLSRLLSPRRLAPETQYEAFLVPAFEAGRLAGLDRGDPAAAPVQQPAWGTAAHVNDRDLPFYHRFAFATGTASDFETLARRLVPAPAGQRFGKRPMDVGAPGFGTTARPGASVELECALAPPDLQRAPFPASPGADVAAEVAAIVDDAEHRRTAVETDDPLVVPPAYGRWHAGVPRVADAGTALEWLAELNLDLRSRAAAGLGAEVVRERQEELVQRAWEQVGEVEAANQRLREAELARSASEALYRKHVARAGDPDRVLVLTSTAHAGLSVPAPGDTTSIRGAVDASRVPAAAEAPAFRRITRPQRPLMRRLTGAPNLTRFQRGLLDEMNAADPAAALSAAPPPPDPAASVPLQAVRDAVATAAATLEAKQERPERVFLSLAYTDLRARREATPPQDLDALAAATLRASLQARVDARYPPGDSTPEQAATAARVKALAQAITDVGADGADGARITIAQAAFAAEFGTRIAGKAYAGLTVSGDAPPAGAELARMTDAQDVALFATSLGSFESGVVAARPDPPPAQQLQPPSALAGHVLAVLAPSRALGARLAAAVPAIAGRPAGGPRRLAPVMAHPVFRDPLFEPLRALSQDHVIANVSDLPRDSMTLMEPNARFVESFLAGANHAFAQELLWREYPTDRRGTYFKVFWDTRDALDAPGRDDIAAMHEWTGALGEQSPLPAGVLVLVIRGELLEKYPSTVVFAQQARWARSGNPPADDVSLPRVLDPAGQVRHPILHARLEPDITMVGFELSEEEARGHRPAAPGDATPADPGWFFVLMERPGEPRFGLDDATPAAGLQTWNDLAWDALAFPGATPYVEISANAALAPARAQAAGWGRTAADMAAILFQSPVLLARHAAEMLP
jgi:hypothetical protein